MIKHLITLILLILTAQIYSQKKLIDGYVILETNDTVIGKLRDKEYYSANGVKIFFENKSIRVSKNKISEIHLDSVRYVKSDKDIWFKRFFKKEETGSINLYSYKSKKMLGSFDSDVNISRLKPSVKFYCSDYPNLSDSIKFLNKKNIAGFINNYNVWKVNNPDSQSYFENHIHSKPMINLKLSFLFPGAGFEFGLSEEFSISSMLKNEVGYASSVGWIINPFLDNQFRYYHNIRNRKADNKRTYKYSANYACIVNVYFFESKANLFGIEYGWQRIINKHWYYNIGFGFARWTTGNKNFMLIYDIDFGYNF